ncbi:helicase [Pseudomonas sp. J237]|jgi:hypothetical protein|uniref:DUF3859 domain-containing protein n=1 Tax=Pseudomonas marincola TaxID=437900 RepID=UPI0008546F59|nr:MULTISPECIES: DUF3859 domain-containing protein [Pseudomonas]OEO26265.1 helicase [Pseudomonas sp. J237]
MFYSRLPALLSVACLTFATATHAEVRVEGPVEYGVFPSDYKEFKSGERILGQAGRPMERTEVVPAKLGSKFGVRYQLSGKSKGEEPLTLLYLTPGVITPDGKRHDKFVVQQEVAADVKNDVMAYEFTEAYEIVPGEWQFMVFQGDRKLLEQRFTVR